MKREGARRLTPHPLENGEPYGPQVEKLGREANEAPPFIEPTNSVEGVQSPPSIRKKTRLEQLEEMRALKKEISKNEDISPQNESPAIIEKLMEETNEETILQPLNLEPSSNRPISKKEIAFEFSAQDNYTTLGKEYNLSIQPNGTVQGWGNNRKLKKLLKTDDEFAGRYARIKAEKNPINIPPPGKVKRFFQRVGFALGITAAGIGATKAGIEIAKAGEEAGRQEEAQIAADLARDLRQDKGKSYDIKKSDKHTGFVDLKYSEIPTAERENIDFEAEKVRGNTQEQYDLAMKRAAIKKVLSETPPSTQEGMEDAFRGAEPQVPPSTKNK
ncbi:MAG: hypothetical protein HOE80_01705 [Candidatus Magasanikbacteria bacterium]|jgi:hypothetical protein|nr:hypothetical protein [Candidatus Magasanikbacteria bacterium]